MEEIEITFLDIDVTKFEERLKSLGAQKVGDFHYRRIIFDYSDFRLDKAGAWIRLRDEGDKVTFAYKQRIGIDKGASGDEGMFERETIVNDFEATRDILLKIGLVEKMYQENKRTRYVHEAV